jgi:hypothetical protein
MKTTILSLFLILSIAAFAQNNSPVGKWELKEHTIWDQETSFFKNVYTNQFTHIYTFYADGSWELQSNGEVTHGIWKLKSNGKKLIMKSKENDVNYSSKCTQKLNFENELSIIEMLPELYDENTEEEGGSSKLVRIKG